MLELVALYYPTIIGSVFVAMALALVGIHLASRHQGVQTLVLSQASALGVLLGLAVALLVGFQGGEDVLPLVGSFILGPAVYLLCEKTIGRFLTSEDSYLLSVFCLLLAGSYLVTSMFPALDSHMSASFFGDLALATNFEVYISLAVSFCVLSFFWKFNPQLTLNSFEKAVFKQHFLTEKSWRLEKIFLVLSLLLICLSVQFMGLLFTMGSLFIPSTLLAHRASGAKAFFVVTLGVAALGCLLGFLLSLVSEKLPTVPTILVSYFVFGRGFFLLPRN